MMKQLKLFECNMPLNQWKTNIIDDYNKCKNFSAVARKYNLSDSVIKKVVTGSGKVYTPKKDPSNKDISEFLNKSRIFKHKFSKDIEDRIKREYYMQKISLRELGEKFGVSYQTIHNIIKDKYPLNKK